MVESIAVRRARPEDAAHVAAVLRRSSVELCAADHNHDPAILEPWLHNKTTENARTWIEAPGNFVVVVVADANADICGVASLSAVGMILLCYVLPEVR
jgi:hypothetical protein